MPDNRPNLQVNQLFEGNDVNDQNGWPVPLVKPSGTLRVVISDGQRGQTRSFQAMATSRQNDVGSPETKTSVPRDGIDGLSVSIKKTDGNSLA